MSYEIPQTIKYKEKIIFKLSLMQAGWIGLFGVLILILFLKTPLIFEAKIVLTVLFGLVGIGFAFFDLITHIKTFFGFVSKPRHLGYLDKKINSFVEVNRIENNVVYLKDGTLKAIIQVQPINFHILSTNQQNAIISAYRDFLNAIDFPIQIVMRTVNLNLSEYLTELDLNVKKRKGLEKQFTDFKKFIENYITEHAVKNRLFYIIIPFSEKNGFLKTSNQEIQLTNRVKLCQEKLKNCNLATKRLNTDELTGLLSSYFETFIQNNSEYQDMLTILEGVDNEIN